jgi:hypothetical protein
VQKQNAEHSSFLRRPKRQLATLVEYLERPEDPELHALLLLHHRFGVKQA